MINLTGVAFTIFYIFWKYQMGSTMKQSIFDEQTSKALKHWQMKALKKKTDGKPGKPATQTLGGSPCDSPVQSPGHPRPRPKNTGHLDQEMADVEADALTPKRKANTMTTIDLM